MINYEGNTNAQQHQIYIIFISLHLSTTKSIKQPQFICVSVHSHKQALFLCKVLTGNTVNPR